MRQGDSKTGREGDREIVRERERMKDRERVCETVIQK